MMSQYLPSVLQGRGAESSISTERALKQIRDLLGHMLEELQPGDQEWEDMLDASLDDLDMMIRAIRREDD